MKTEHASLQSTLLCRARFFAEHASLQSTLLCTARFFAEHASLQSTLLCRALSFAEHSPLQSTLLCRAGQALSLEGVSQMDSILPERLLALVLPGNDLILRRIQSLKRCVQACGCKIMTPRYAPQFGSRLHFKRCQALPKVAPFPFFSGTPFFGTPQAYLGVIILQPHLHAAF